MRFLRNGLYLIVGWAVSPVTSRRDQITVNMLAYSSVVVFFAVVGLTLLAFVTWDGSWYSWKAFRISLIVSVGIMLAAHADNDK